MKNRAFTAPVKLFPETRPEALQKNNAKVSEKSEKPLLLAWAGLVNAVKEERKARVGGRVVSGHKFSRAVTIEKVSGPLAAASISPCLSCALPNLSSLMSAFRALKQTNRRTHRKLEFFFPKKRRKAFQGLPQSAAGQGYELYKTRKSRCC
jgi:hypothetical protein